jgi:hypothetical protein
MYLIYAGLVFWAHLAPKSAPNVGPVPFNQSAELVIDAFFIVLLLAVILLFLLLAYWLSPVLRVEFPTMNVCCPALLCSHVLAASDSVTFNMRRLHGVSGVCFVGRHDPWIARLAVNLGS